MSYPRRGRQGTGLPKLSECRDCHDPIRFVRMDDTGRALPVNPAPHTDGGGNVAARMQGAGLTGFVIGKDRRPGPGDPFRFTAHHATCEARKSKEKPTPPPPPVLF